jgi:pimeloyl-ACP methyl ester carboxylesterase
MSIAPPDGRLPRRTRHVPLSQGGLFVGMAGGAAPPILCIPGGYHGAWCYDLWMEAFAEAGIAAAALEPRGKGTLEAAASPATGIDDYASDAVEAAGQLGGAVVLLGHSLGALIAMRAAMRLERVAGLLLIAPSPPANLPGAAAVRLVPDGPMVAPPADAVVVDRYLRGDRPEGVAAYLAALSPESPRVLNDRYALRIPVEPARFAGLPVLVIEAGRDDAERHPPGQDAAIAGFLGGEHLLLPEAPHCMMLAPWAAEGAAAIIAWHRRHFGPR